MGTFEEEVPYVVPALYGYAAVCFTLAILLPFSVWFCNTVPLVLAFYEDELDEVVKDEGLDGRRTALVVLSVLRLVAMWGAFLLLGCAFLKVVDWGVGISMLAVVASVMPGTALFIWLMKRYFRK
jgi:hypothetical protein